MAQLDFGLQALQATLACLYNLAIGGKAVGMGLNVHPRFGDLTASYIAGVTGSPFRSASNKFFCLVRPRCPGACFRGAAHLVRRAAEACQRYALLASCPRCGLGELIISENEPGSSIVAGLEPPYRL
jgi:fumarate hydratase class II